MTIAEVIKEHGITMEVEPADNNPIMIGAPTGARHYLVALKSKYNEGPIVETHFTMGSAYTDLPTPEMVLDSIVMDSVSFINSVDFTDFCNEFGYSNDSIKAKKVYDTCGEIKNQFDRLLNFPGDNYYFDIEPE